MSQTAQIRFCGYCGGAIDHAASPPQCSACRLPIPTVEIVVEHPHRRQTALYLNGHKVLVMQTDTPGHHAMGPEWPLAALGDMGLIRASTSEASTGWARTFPDRSSALRRAEPPRTLSLSDGHGAA
jgi:hypothetical protein